VEKKIKFFEFYGVRCLSSPVVYTLRCCSRRGVCGWSRRRHNGHEKIPQEKYCALESPCNTATPPPPPPPPGARFVLYTHVGLRDVYFVFGRRVDVVVVFYFNIVTICTPANNNIFVENINTIMRCFDNGFHARNRDRPVVVGASQIIQTIYIVTTRPE